MNQNVPLQQPLRAQAVVHAINYQRSSTWRRRIREAMGRAGPPGIRTITRTTSLRIVQSRLAKQEMTFPYRSRKVHSDANYEYIQSGDWKTVRRSSKGTSPDRDQDQSGRDSA